MLNGYCEDEMAEWSKGPRQSRFREWWDERGEGENEAWVSGEGRDMLRGSYAVDIRPEQKSYLHTLPSGFRRRGHGSER